MQVNWSWLITPTVRTSPGSAANLCHAANAYQYDSPHNCEKAQVWPLYIFFFIQSRIPLSGGFGIDNVPQAFEKRRRSCFHFKKNFADGCTDTGLKNLALVARRLIRSARPTTCYTVCHICGATFCMILMIIRKKRFVNLENSKVYQIS